MADITPRIRGLKSVAADHVAKAADYIAAGDADPDARRRHYASAAEHHEAAARALRSLADRDGVDPTELGSVS
ncbi:hypothetical protein ACIBSV_46925 [Embleya sp. NPDC050154]|uniref:hypothetical protein n=1 Tax=Embleya sp. NPDC050154 TaxID=3363988 RepID=UPI0037A0E0ED